MSGFIQEKLDSLHNLIEGIETLQADDERGFAKTWQKFKCDVDEFQENPQLLDTNLTAYIDKIIALVIKFKNVSKKHVDITFKCAYLLTKTRGFKVVINRLPHDVKDMYVVLEMLKREDPRNPENWETKYMLLLWLSILVLIPLDMKRFDSGQEEKILTDEIFEIIQTYLSESRSKDQDIASFLAARFLTRPEIVPKYLRIYVEWSLEFIFKPNTNSHLATQVAILASFYYLFKIGRRDDISQFGNSILAAISRDSIMSHQNDKIVLNSVKVIQRIGLNLLPIREAVWRYKKKHKVLKISADGDSLVSKPQVDEDFEAPEHLEEIIDLLLKGLRKSNTPTRWSAAKGIGRICSRLPKEMAEMVTESVLCLFSFGESDSSWHGGCLALAELGRRGLLLPNQFPSVFEVIKKAVVYDEYKGCFSVGSHVRDAACYVCWSFARSYDPDILKPFVDDLACSLLIVSVYDREVSCRRAAAAAFQENVGRQGALPEGIEIVSVIDYSSVGLRKNAYLHLAPFLAKFETYQKPLIDHLLQRKVNHYDKEIRFLAAESLSLLCMQVSDKSILDEVITRLTSMSLERDLNTRHGGVLALGRMLVTLAKKEVIISEDFMKHLKSLLAIYKERKYLNSIDSETVRESFCYFLKHAAYAKLPVHDDVALISDWTDEIVDSILNCRKNKDLLMQATECIPIFSKEYLTTIEQMDKLFDVFTSNLSSPEECLRSWIFNVFTYLPIEVISNSNRSVLVNILVKSITSPSRTEKAMTEMRASAITCLSSTLKKLPEESIVGLSSNSFLNDTIIRGCFIAGTKDYTTGSRGDIGLFVRWNSIQAIQDLLTYVITLPSSLSSVKNQVVDDHALIEEVICCICTQCVSNQEKQMRPHAFKTLLSLISSLPWTPHQEDMKKLLDKVGRESLCKLDIPATSTISSKTILGDSAGDDCNPTTTSTLTSLSSMTDDTSRGESKKSSEKKDELLEENQVGVQDQHVLDIMIEMLPFDSLTRSLWEGLVSSIGGLTLSVSKVARASLGAFLKRHQKSDPNSYSRIMDHLLNLYEQEVQSPRLSLPLLHTYEFLMSSGFLDSLHDVNGRHDGNSHIKNILKTTWDGIKASDPSKKMAGISIFCHAFRFSSIYKIPLANLLSMLCSPLPRIRVSTADNLQVSVLTFSDHLFKCIEGEDEEDIACQEVLTILRDTDWSQPVSELKPIRQRLYLLFGLKAP